MKKIISLVLVMILILSSLVLLTGCGNSSEEKGEKVKSSEKANTKKEAKKDLAEVSYTLGKGTITVNVPKNEDGTPKYEFTTEKPEGVSVSSTVYLVTDNAVLGISTGGLSYHTSKDYKEKFGEQKATFEGYLEFIDSELFNKSYLPGLENTEINGRKAIKYYNRSGSSDNMKYLGFFYAIGVDDIYPGSRLQITANYKDEEKPTESKELDQETLDIIDSLKVTSNE